MMRLVPLCLETRYDTALDFPESCSHKLYTPPEREREREREYVCWGVVRDYQFGGGCNVCYFFPKHNLAVWNVPRLCPLVLLVKDLINFEFKDAARRIAAVVEMARTDRKARGSVLRNTQCCQVSFSLVICCMIYN
jgi:hypothetical protein